MQSRHNHSKIEIFLYTSFFVLVQRGYMAQLVSQFIGPTQAEIEQMLQVFGASSVDELYNRIVPLAHQHPGILKSLGKAKSESEVRRIMESASLENILVKPSFRYAGAGYYTRDIPTAVSRISLRGEFETGYTPYQAEASPGVLLTLFDFQSIMSELTKMEVVNAGTYNGIDALVQAALMACRIAGKNTVYISEAIHPAAANTLRTYANANRINLKFLPTTDGYTLPETIENLVEDAAAVIVQCPNFYGIIDGMQGQADAIHQKKALYIMYGGGDQISLAMLKRPGEIGVDIYAGEGQHFGIPTGFGGPYVGILGIKNPEHVRQLPGRLVLQGEDIEGNRMWMLGLQTREQHIRRERATSNECTAETLIAIMAAVYTALLGPEGLLNAAEQSCQIAHFISDDVAKIKGYELVYPESVFFNEFMVRTPVPAARIVDYMMKRGVLPGVAVAREIHYSGIIPDVLMISATEGNNDSSSILRLLEGLERYATAN